MAATLDDLLKEMKVQTDLLGKIVVLDQAILQGRQVKV